MKKPFIALGLLIVLAAIILLVIPKITNNNQAGHTPQISSADFSSTVTNTYFTLTPSKQWIYEGDTKEGHERIEVTVTGEKKIVMGVETTVVRDQVFLDGELIEDTWDWYAQDAEGNVWYFGEKTAEYEDGKVTTTAGSWEAGVDGAQPGIIMLAQPKVGTTYRQEYYAGEAEDRADILALDETVTVLAGTYSGCLKTYDYTPLDPKSRENKYYCPGTGGITLEVNLNNNERIELVSVK